MFGFGLAAAVAADEPKRDQAIYVDDFKDPVIEEMEQANEARAEAARAKTAELIAAYRDAEKARNEPEQRLRFDLSGLVKPPSPDAFTSKVWHFPPTPQYNTGSCWSFSATSFMRVGDQAPARRRDQAVGDVDGVLGVRGEGARPRRVARREPVQPRLAGRGAAADVPHARRGAAVGL